jgi:hypothetical protein
LAGKTMQTVYFCTLFDHNYLLKGLALYDSLLRTHPQFKLWILAMSEECYGILAKLALKNVEIIRLSDFEDEELLKIKSTRTVTEYCWTVTPSLPLYVLKIRPELRQISYIDADCFFFSNVSPLHEEMGKKSTLIIGHNFTADRTEFVKTSGKYNVGLLTFKNDKWGHEVLNWWRERCNEWCFFRHEDGKLGDQMYLNVWPEKFYGVHELRHKGGCVAPWNVWRYLVYRLNGKVYVDQDSLVFYHFHALRILPSGNVFPAKGYDFSKRQLELIYAPYEQAIKGALQRVRAVVPDFKAGMLEEEETIPAPVSEVRERFHIRGRQIRRFAGRFKRAVFGLKLFRDITT